jgi:hypothetical protein
MISVAFKQIAYNTVKFCKPEVEEQFSGKVSPVGDLLH